MADRYWVGGSGNWDATSTANWSTSSGGASGASAPTSADNVIFDAASNTGTNPFTVTITGTTVAPAVCNDFSTGGAGGALDGTMTLASAASTSVLDIYGSLTLPATNFSWSPSNGLSLYFKGTSTHSITTNGNTLNTTTVFIAGSGGTYTLGSAFTLNSTRTLQVDVGTFSTSASNYSMNVGQLSSSNSNTRTITLNASAITLSGTTPANFATTTNLTFNAGTSTITCSNASPTFTGGGLTFYDVTFSSTASGTTTISGANTFNNLTQTSRSGTGIRALIFGDNQTVSGTLTLGAGNTAIRRILVVSNNVGTRRTITLNGTLATLADVDFRDIGAAGSVATPWTGTRLGDGLNNNNITFSAAKTVYWNLAGTQNWSATGWATTNNGTPAVNNFPLAQDTAVFTEAGAAGTVTMESGWWIGEIQMADGVSNRTTAFTLTITSGVINVYKNVTLFSSLTVSGAGTLIFRGQSTTQIFTSAGVSLTCGFTVDVPSGTFQLADNLTNTGTVFTLTAGTLDLSSGNRTLTCVTFSSSNSNTRSIAFGTGNITVTGNNTTVWTTATATNFSYTGTPTVNFTYSGSTGTRTISNHLTNGTESNSLNFNITAGTDTITISTSGTAKNVSFSGFAGTANLTATMYGDLVLGSGMTIVSATSGTTFAATSGTQAITSAGVTIDRPLTVNAPGATVQLQDALTLGSTRTFTLTNGTLDLTGNSGNWTLSTGAFSSSNSNTRSIAFGTGQITVTGNNGPVWNMSTLTNFSYTGTSKVVSNYSGSTGTRTFTHGTSITGTEANAVSFEITNGTDSVTLTALFFAKNLNFTGFNGVLTANNRNIYGNLTLSSGMTLNSSATNVTTFAATSGTQQITTNGQTLDFPIVVNAPGATVQLQDALALGSTKTLTLTAGTFTANNQNCTTGLFASSNTNVRTLTMGSGTWTIQGTGTAWDITDPTNLTLNAGTSTITMTSASAKSFAGGDKTYYVLNQGGAGVLTIAGSNTFTTLSTAILPTTITFTNGTTQSVGNFNLSGTAGNLVTINSTSSGSQFNLVKLTGSKALVSYLSITDSAASPVGYWFAPTSQGNVNGGNNTGWNFLSAGLVSAFLIF